MSIQKEDFQDSYKIVERNGGSITLQKGDKDEITPTLRVVDANLEITLQLKNTQMPLVFLVSLGENKVKVDPLGEINTEHIGIYENTIFVLFRSLINN